MPEVGSISVTGSLKTELVCNINLYKNSIYHCHFKFESYKPYYFLHNFPPIPCFISIGSLFYFICMSECFAHLHVCAPCACLVPSEARGSSYISRNWCSRHLWATMCVPEIKLPSSARSTLNDRVISPAPLVAFWKRIRDSVLFKVNFLKILAVVLEYQS